jgi:hypothetical protein
MNYITSSVGISEYSYNRIDFRFDCLEDNYDEYLKLNLLLIALIGDVYKVKDDYFSTKLFSKKPLTVSVKNDYFACVYYNKKIESNDRVPPKARLELRSLKISKNIPDLIYEDWNLRFNKAIQNYHALQDRFNNELVSLYNESIGKSPRLFRNLTDFIIEYQNSIFSRVNMVGIQLD